MATDRDKREFLYQLEQAESTLKRAITLGKSIGETVTTLEAELVDLQTEIAARKAAIAS